MREDNPLNKIHPIIRRLQSTESPSSFIEILTDVLYDQEDSIRKLMAGIAREKAINKSNEVDK